MPHADGAPLQPTRSFREPSKPTERVYLGASWDASGGDQGGLAVKKATLSQSKSFARGQELATIYGERGWGLMLIIVVCLDL